MASATSPSLFLSHGAPTLALEPNAAHLFLRRLPQQLPPPRAILAVSAHWTTAEPAVGTGAKPDTIHDFAGFPPQLYDLTYPAPGAPDVADEVHALLQGAGIAVTRDPDRGLDHGAWVPLRLMYPHADVPVTQLSIQPHLGPAHHLALGRTLQTLRRRGVLLLASGGLVHNLGRLDRSSQPPPWAAQFEQWMTDAVVGGDLEALLAYRQRAPHAEDAHPTDEHLLPLFVALGAAGDRPRGSVLHRSFTYGSLSMASYAFSEG
ncbi:MAG: class III extradiol ring-cleavage dioxygenase [Gammaproteobacteria bacterium]